MILGVAGCGRMGLPMAEAMARAGFQVKGFDIKPIASPLMVPTVDAFAYDITHLITVVRDAAQTDAVLFTDQALLKHAPNLTHIILCSTLSPRYVLDLIHRIPRHITLVDAPMSGAAIGAQKAELTFMLGGSDKTLDPLRPLFSAMGTHCHHMGGYGAGMTAKVLNNLVAAASTAATRTALAWGDALGLDEKRLLDLMQDSSGQTWFGSGFDEIEFARDGFDPENSIGILKKDVEAAVDAAPENARTDLAEALIATLQYLPKRP